MSAWIAGLQDTLGRVLGALADPQRWGPLLQAILLIVAGVVLARIVHRLVARLARKAPAQTRVLLERAASWTILAVFTVSALRELGFDFTVILGAAGILTAAAAFASQTSASNVISGLFLGIEGTVRPGDVITVNGVTGEVLAIDLLSTRLRTFDNLMVRIPNETMMKVDITNLHRFPIRRYDLRIGVSYASNLADVKRVLEEVADRHPLVLEEPAPLIIAQGYGPSSIDLQLSVWSRREAYLDVRNAMQQQVKEAFDRAGIEIPFPQVTLHARDGVGGTPAPAGAVVRDDDPADAAYPEVDGPGGDGPSGGGVRGNGADGNGADGADRDGSGR